MTITETSASTSGPTVSVVHLEYVEGGSDKFYRVFLLGDEVTCQYGRNGTYGTFTPRKAAKSADAAKVAADKAVAGKAAKGYKVTRSAERVFSATPNDGNLSSWADGLSEGASVAVTVPAEREQSAVVTEVNAEEVDPEALGRVEKALRIAGLVQTDRPVSSGTPLAMLAHNVEPGNLPDLLAHTGWVMQPKLDGDRLLVEVIDGQVRAFNRNGQPKSSNVGAAMLAPFRALTQGRWVFDGEVVGRTLHLFDLTEADGWVTPSEWFVVRYAALRTILTALGVDPAVVAPVDTAKTETEKRAMLAAAEKGRKEGIILRAVNSPYAVGRSFSLLRHKFTKTIDAEVIEIGGGKNVTTYVATFTPQAWANNYAIDVDPEGDTEWTVSDEGTDDAAQIVAEDQFGLDRDDRLKSDPAAPKWVREWTGPFSIHVEAKVRSGGKQSAALAVYDHEGAQVRIGNVTTIGKGGPGGIQVGQVVEVQFLYVVNPASPVLYQPRILRVRTDKAASECSVDQLIGTHTDRAV